MDRAAELFVHILLFQCPGCGHPMSSAITRWNEIWKKRMRAPCPPLRLWMDWDSNRITGQKALSGSTGLISAFSLMFQLCN